MAIELSTAGILVKWAVETTAGTKPSTGFTELVGVKSISEYNPEPNMLDTTPLKETKAHTYIPGLWDAGGAQQLTVNDYDDFRTSYAALYSAYETAMESGKALWIEYEVPNMSGDNGFFFTAIPSPLGFGGADVDAVLENVVYLTPTNAPEWDAAV